MYSQIACAAHCSNEARGSSSKISFNIDERSRPEQQSGKVNRSDRPPTNILLILASRSLRVLRFPFSLRRRKFFIADPPPSSHSFRKYSHWPKVELLSRNNSSEGQSPHQRKIVRLDASLGAKCRFAFTSEAAQSRTFRDQPRTAR